MAVLLVALRTDKAFEKVKAFLDSKAMGGFAVREVASGENEHWHWLIESKYKNVQTFRVNLLKAVEELKGNASYSASEVKDLEKYERYLSKGESHGVLPEIAWRNSMKYQDEKVAELHDEYWQENAKLKKRKVGSMLDWTVDAAKEAGIAWDQRGRLAELYTREVVRRGKPFNHFAARSAINTVQMLLCPDDTALKSFAEQL